jgi:MraZ protein
MFLGSFTHTLDDKGRLTIPAKYRPELAAGVVVTRGLDRNLVIYPADEWQRMSERIRQLPYTDKNARDFRRLVFALATDAVPDKQGRILIPAELREYAGIDGEAVVVGMDSTIEVWSPAVWQSLRETVEHEAGQADNWLNLGI